MLQQKKSLMQKVPDIQTALRAVDFLIQKKVNFASVLCLEFPCLFIDPGIASRQQCILFCFSQEANESFQSQFELSDNVFAHATVQPDDKVCLWLGVRCVYC